MDPRSGSRFARKATFPIERLTATAAPFELQLADARLTDDGMAGSFDGVEWELRWTASGRSYAHVSPLLERLGVASTVLELPHADVAIDGTVAFNGERLVLSGARGAQAHVWGTRHAESWAWVHCNDFSSYDGQSITDSFVDGVSATVARAGRVLGPFTAVVARVNGRDFVSTSPLRVVANRSDYALTGWRFEAVARGTKLIGEVDASREQLVGVTYHDPDGRPAYCYNSETASMRLQMHERVRGSGGWAHRQTLFARGRAHYEYGQRTPVPDLPLLIQ